MAASLRLSSAPILNSLRFLRIIVLVKSTSQVSFVEKESGIIKQQHNAKRNNKFKYGHDRTYNDFNNVLVMNSQGKNNDVIAMVTKGNNVKN